MRRKNVYGMIFPRFVRHNSLPTFEITTIFELQKIEFEIFVSTLIFLVHFRRLENYVYS